MPKKPVAPPAHLPLFDEHDGPTASGKSVANKTAEPSRHPWPYLLKRVFAVDILVCVRCGGRLRIVEVAKKPGNAGRVLGERGWARAPPRAPPSAELQAFAPFAHGQLRLQFG